MRRACLAKSLGAVAALLAHGSLCGPVAAQERNRDQVGVVVPAFEAESEIGLHVAHAIKSGVQTQLSSQDPVTGVKGIGHAISYYVPAAMASTSHESAARLARLNGLQGTVWGYAVPLRDGVAIQAHLTLSEPFEDFRSKKREIWSHEFAGMTLDLGPPRMAIAFLPSTFSLDFVERFGNRSEIEYCRIDSGECRTFSTPEIERAFGIEDDRALVRRGHIDYYVNFPNTALLKSDIIDYTGIFLSYARGNLRQTIQLSDRYLEVHRDVSSRIDVLLYRAAAHARLSQFKEAWESVDAALRLNGTAPRVLRYAIMVELSSANALTDRARSLSETLLNMSPGTDAFDVAIGKLVQ